MARLEVQDQRLRLRFRIDRLEDHLLHSGGVDPKQRHVDPEHKNAGDRRALRMFAHTTPGRLLARDLAENLHLRPTRPVDHSENCLSDGKQQAEHGSGDEHTDGGHQGRDTVVLADLQVAANGRQVHEAPHGVDHDGAEDCLGKDGECRGDEKDGGDRDDRSREAADLGRAAGPIHGGSLGQAPGHSQAAEQTRANIGAAEGDEFLVGVQPVATLGGVQSSGTQPLGKADECDGGPREGDVDEPI